MPKDDTSSEHKQPFATNPYPRRKGFGFRLHNARTALIKFGRAAVAEPYSRGFDNSFEGGDGQAVVWALMHDAITYENADLRRGIENMGSKVWPQWLAIYRADPTDPALPVISTYCIMSSDDLAALVTHLGPMHAITQRVRSDLASVSHPDDEKYRDAARRHARDGELEIDANALVSKGTDVGAYVMAWLWITDEEAGIEPVTETDPS